MTRLAELLEAKGLTVRKLSMLAGIPERTVYRHIAGKTQPDLLQAAAYAKALAVTLDELVIQ